MGRFDDARRYWNEEAGPRWVRVSSLLDEAMAPVDARLFSRAAAAPGERVLDVGCGAGATTAAFAEAVGPGGSVLAVDISEPLAAAARERLERYGDRAEVVVGDAETYDVAAAGPRDLVASRFGVMFFADSAAAFANLGRSLEPGGRLAFVCWQRADRNPWITAPLTAAGDLVAPPEMPDGDAPGPFRFADPEVTAAVLGSAGFADVAVEPLELELSLAASPPEILGFYLQVGPLARAIEPLDGAARTEVEGRVLAEIERRHDGSQLSLGAGMWLVSARWP